MECPDCGERTNVIETVRYPDRVRRRRECDACGHRFTTDERPRSDGDSDDPTREA